MASQIDKFNQRYGNRKKTGNSPKGVDFAEQFNASEQYKKAKDMGIDLSGFSVDSEESLKKALIEINKLITEKEANTPPSAENKDDQKKDTPDKDDDTLEIDEAGGDAKENLEVNGSGKENNQHHNDTPNNSDWINSKREFYSKFAQENNVTFKNDAEKDTSEKAFTFSFEKDGKSLGEVRYNSPKSVTISNDAELLMYKGIVKDALENNLNLSFGNSLTDKQKAMLLAATLMSEKKTYNDGSGIVLKNPPTIDIKAEYFKTLPQNIQSVLKVHADKQEEAKKTAEQKEQREAADKKIKELKDKIKAKAKADGKDIKDLTTEEYRAAMLEGMSDEQKKAHLDKMEEREKRTAARLGITGEYKTKDKDGKDVIIKEDAKTKALYTDENSPLKERYNALLEKYKGRS